MAGTERIVCKKLFQECEEDPTAASQFAMKIERAVKKNSGF